MKYKPWNKKSRKNRSILSTKYWSNPLHRIAHSERSIKRNQGIYLRKWWKENDGKVKWTDARKKAQGIMMAKYWKKNRGKRPHSEATKLKMKEIYWSKHKGGKNVK